MTKKELGQIYSINREIQMWEKELESIHCKSLMIGQKITGMPRNSTGTSDKVGDMAATIVDIEDIIRGKLVEIQLQKKRIMEFISMIEDSQIRQIVFLRNISCMSWKDIAKEVGGNNTADSVRKMYDRFLKS